MFHTVTLRATAADTLDLAECSDCGALVRSEEAVLLLHESHHKVEVVDEPVPLPQV